MAEQNNQVTEEIRVVDRATAPLARIADMGKRVANNFGALASTALNLGGFAGMFGIAKAVHETDQLYQSVARVRAMTGATAENAHSMLEAFGMSGIEAGHAERVLTNMAKAADTVRGQITAADDEGATLLRQFDAIGVAVKKGPQQAMVDMAKAAQQGQLGMRDLIKLFGVPARQAGQMMVMLQQGPAHVQKLMDDQLKAGDVINEQALANFEQMQKARREMSDAWGEVVGIFYKALMPGATRFLEIMRDKMAGWAPAAERFGKALADNMDHVVAAAGTLLKIMVANKAVTMATGVGLGEHLKRAQAAVKRNMPVAPGGGKIINALGGAAAGSGPVGAALVTQMAKWKELGTVSKVMSGIVKTLMGLAPVAGIFGAIAVGIGLIAGNVGGLGDKFREIFTRLAQAFGGLLSAVSPLIVAIGETLVWAIEKAFGAISFVAGGLGKIATVAKAAFSGKSVYEHIETAKKSTGSKAAGESDAAFEARFKANLKKSYDEAPDFGDRLIAAENDVQNAMKSKTKMTEGATPPGARGGTQVYQDFRGSKFEITQAFAEGFDPDRVAVVMIDKIAAMGERRYQSGMVPLFSVR